MDINRAGHDVKRDITVSDDDLNTQCSPRNTVMKDNASNIQSKQLFHGQNENSSEGHQKQDFILHGVQAINVSKDKSDSADISPANYFNRLEK